MCVCCVDQDSFFYFYKYKNTTLWEKNKEDEEKAKCVTKDRTAATQSFGKVLVHQVIQYIYIYKYSDLLNTEVV